MPAKAKISLDNLDAPEWFLQAAEELKPLSPKWAKSLPSIALRAGGELPAEAFPWLLASLRFTEEEAIRHDVVDLLRSRADRDSLDAWMAFVMKTWIAAESPAKDAWVLTGAGALGADGTVRALNEAVRAWSREKDRALAVRGLDVLGRIGTALAVKEVATLSAMVRDHSVADEAKGMIERKAAAQGATREQIEDRHVNDCGLDARGERVFNYGPRSFRAALGNGLELALFNQDGSRRVSLPPVAAADNRALAEASRTAWSEVKTGYNRVLKAQLKRFEQAMITGRDWALPDFQQYVLQHPIVSRIAKLLVWKVVDGDLPSVRVADDLTFADASDETVALEETQRLRVAHPLRIAAAELAAWETVFADYSILQPFQQLARKSYLCEPAMTGATTLPVPEHTPLKPGVLYGILDNDGWRLGRQDGGYFFFSWKRFEADGVTAVIHYAGLVAGQIGASPDQRVLQCTFHPEPLADGARPGKPMTLGSVPGAAYSEALRRLLRLTEEKG